MKNINDYIVTFVVVDNVFSEEECKYVLFMYEQFKENAGEWRGTKPLPFDGIPKEFISPVINKIEMVTSNIFKNVVYDRGEIVKWSPSNYQDLHLDKNTFTGNETILTSITYLNENFVGGETYFEDGTLIKPVTGRTLIFNGMQYVHGVKKIIDGVRWTMPIWYKKTVL